jgi:hypothetical protein
LYDVGTARRGKGLSQTKTPVVEPTFGGNAEQRELAARLFRVFQIQGRFFSDIAPVRISVAQFTEFLGTTAGADPDWPAKIDAALSASPEVFARETDEEDVYFVSTRGGRAPFWIEPVDAAHTLPERFLTPEPVREPATPRRATTRHDEWSDATEESESPVVPFAPDSWQAEIARQLREEAAVRAAMQPDTVWEPVEEAEEADLLEPEQSVVPEVAESAIDVAAVGDDELAEAIRTSLGRELSVARWGDYWMAEDRVDRFSRGDLRRIEDFLREQSDPMTDDDIVRDALNVRPSAPDYAARRFALNYRLSRESREFEYLGTDRNGLWGLASAPSIGTTKRKASEIGQDYRYLLDYRTPIEPIEEGLIEHVLTFYEYVYGVLPLDSNVGSIMPAQGFADQRAARVTFESPQTLETVAAELRFPTTNRGGFIAGLERFFAENLVPGAVVTIERTDQPTHFLLEYFRVSGEDRKLLHLDERRGRFVFRSTTYYCATQEEMLLDEHRFPKLADARPLEERVRRRPEQVVAATFERAGDNIGTAAAPRYRASFLDVLAVVNVERPISAEFLRDILTSGTYQEFAAADSQEDTFIYEAGPAAG